MATDAKKHTTIAAGEKPTRAVLASAILSINDIIPVANSTEATQVVLALVALGQSIASTPVTVARADARGLHRIEITYDPAGLVWMPASGVLNFTTKTAADNWGAANPALLTAGDRCTIAGVEYRWSGSLWYQPHAGGRIANGTDGVGVVKVTHGMGKAPAAVTAVVAMDSPVIVDMLKVEVGNLTATTFDVKFRRADQGQGPFAGNPVVFYWTAVA
ncbi:hypothetical protein [Microbacterium maritypicum]|uniref:hypothetical protein n=1 Tax=Microbacterium maritypicum TaxID=33918 RepID=UPI0038188FA1